MIIKILQVVGLALGIVGVLMLFVWGWPQPAFELDYALTLGSVSYESEIAASKARHRVLASSGLFLVVVGQALQLVAAIRSSSKVTHTGGESGN